MENWLEFVEPLALAGTFVFTIVNLISTNKLTRNQQQSSIMSAKRGERIDKIREHSAGIITNCEYLIHDLDNDDTKRDLLYHCHSLISLLQYYNEYKKDIELISTTFKIMELSLADELRKVDLEKEVKKFWWICNVYIGADFERLKNESLGKINRGGASKKEATDFDGLYEKFNADKEHFFPKADTTQAPQR